MKRERKQRGTAPAAHAALMEMWQSDLSSYIDDLFYGDRAQYTEYNLKLAGEVWRERFGQYPTVGEIAILSR